jgi:hypothetical protein
MTAINKRKDTERALEALNAARHALTYLPIALRLALADPEFPIGEMLARKPHEGGLFHKPEQILALLDACEVYAKHPHASLGADKALMLGVIDRTRKLIAESGR